MHVNDNTTTVLLNRKIINNQYLIRDKFKYLKYNFIYPNYNQEFKISFHDVIN